MTPDFRQFWHLSSELLCVRSPEGYLLAVNHCWLDVLGWTSTELQAQPWLDFIHPDDVLETMELEAQVSQKTVPSSQEPRVLRYKNRFRHRQGQYRWLAWRIVWAPDGLSYAAAQDVTESSWSGNLALRAEIQAAIQLRDQAIAASSVGIVIADARLPDMPLIYVNPAFEAITGYTAAEVLGTNCRFLQGPDHDQPALDNLRQAIRAGTDCTVVLQNYRKDGTPFWNELYISPIYSSAGQLTHFVGVQADITKRKRSEFALLAEKEKSEQLLLNVLPKPVADRLKAFQLGVAKRSGEAFIADSFADVSVLFADIVGFTNIASQISPAELLGLLNRVFSVFDDLSQVHGLEKIKTIGDEYLVVGGLLYPKPDHLEAIAQMALDMQAKIGQFKTLKGEPLQLRIGIHCGPVVAGVIGTSKFMYDLWGDAVNVASRMESQGLPGHIQVTETVYARLKSHYRLEPRGKILVKGKGEMLTYWLKG